MLDQARAGNSAVLVAGGESGIGGARTVALALQQVVAGVDDTLRMATGRT